MECKYMQTLFHLQEIVVVGSATAPLDPCALEARSAVLQVVPVPVPVPAAVTMAVVAMAGEGGSGFQS